MIKVLLLDFSRVLLHPTDKTYSGSLNNLHRELKDAESYYLFNYFELNEELLEFLESLKGKFDLRIFTTDIIQNDPLIREKIDPLFSKIYSAFELGITKKEKRSYEFLAKDIGVAPEEILFIDDQESNITPAREAGFKTHHFENNSEIIDYLKKLND